MKNAQPTWKDLAAFTATQAAETRTVIDYWFKFAATLLGFILLVASAFIAFAGWKTIGDAKATAETAAQEAARSKVKEILQDDRIQELVRDTAKDLLSKGAFRQATEEAVRAQLPEAVSTELKKQLATTIAAELARNDLLPRSVPASVEKAFKEKLRPYVGKRVLISFLSEPEPKAFAQSLEHSLNALGLAVTKQESGRSRNQIITSDEGLGTLLENLIGEATGRKETTQIFNKNLPGNPARAELGRQFAATGNLIVIPDADVYIEIGVKEAKRQ